MMEKMNKTSTTIGYVPKALEEVWEMKAEVYEQTKNMSIEEFSTFINKSVDSILRENNFVKILNDDGSYKIKKVHS
jgi:hypothetical protein